MKVIVEKFLEHNMFRMMTTHHERKLGVYLDSESGGRTGYVVVDDHRSNPQMKIFLPCVSIMRAQKNIVAYKYFKRAGNLVFMIRAYILHEFGHILHQLMNPYYYWGLNDCLSCSCGMTEEKRAS